MIWEDKVNEPLKSHNQLCTDLYNFNQKFVS